MKTLTVSLLVCAMMTLNEAAAHPKAEAEKEIAPLIQEVSSSEKAVMERSTSCSGGWIGFRDRCFRYIPTTKTWAAAEKYCQSMGANLASVHSVEEYHKIQNIIAKETHGYRETWLGGSDAEQEGIWLWSDGTPFNFRHCGGFDNYVGRQHCLQMNYGDQKCWDDTWCDVHLPFVCARKY